jgi:hypothetical protein
MTFSDWRHRGWTAFIEIANLTIFTILCMASFLTGDKLLFGIGIVVEGFYLVWASWSARYRKRLELRVKSGRHAVTFLDGVLLVVTIMGFVVILFFGFGKHLLSHRWPYLTHAEGWEAGAIGWTGLFLFYYIAKFRDIRSLPVNTIVKALLLLASGWLLVAAWNSIRTTRERPMEHVLYVWLIGVSFLFTDLLVMKYHDDPKECNLSRSSLMWADIPMVVAFFVLLVYLGFHPDTENKDVFVSGVVSCQLLISNVVFIVMEFGLLQSPKR